ncbi:MAG: glutamate--tRNA ligase [Candidatus Aenigmarchaeota archaeon]|nr:glutamate--tRNA ligase [Candidatus Aenigmarchaeota archaeon]
MEDEIKRNILKHALLNAVEFNGKANPNAVLGKVIAENPKLKENIKETIKIINEIVKEINAWDIKKQKEELEKFGKIEKPKKEERKGLPPLPNAIQGKVITRFAPFPSGALHIGNVKAAVTSYEYAKMYNGRFIVRIEDTDPDPEKVNKENIELIKLDLEALGIKPDLFYFNSEHFQRYYEIAEELIKNGKAYVCTCSTRGKKKEEKIAILKVECDCRKNTIEKNFELYKKMFTEFNEGDAVLRLKTNINDPNPALRDPALLRIKNGKHPITGKEYRVYPLYNFSCAIEDHDTKVTHVLRAVEHTTNTLIQKKIFEALNWNNFPYVINFGFLYVEESKVHKRFIRDGIAKGIFSGWDDPKLGQYGLVRALIRRGIMPEAIKNMIIEMGITPQTVHFTWDKLYTENRKIIDPISERYFGVINKKKIILDKLLTKEVKAKKHPSKEEFRIIPLEKEIFIEEEDFEKNKGKEVRLMHFCNIILPKRGNKVKVSGIELKDIPKIHWVPEKYSKEVKLIMPDGTEKIILVEPEVEKVKPGQIIQFERVGFAKCDKENIFYFAHK